LKQPATLSPQEIQMNKSVFVLIALVLVASVSACSASLKTGADWRGAYDQATDSCDRQKSPSQEVYIACLERKEADRRETAARIASLPTQPTAVAPVAAPPSAPPPVPSAPPAPTPTVAQPLPGSTVIISPESAGPFCSADPMYTLEVYNPNDTALVEVRADGRIKPLDCEGSKLVYVDVTRRNGRIDRVALIPPGMMVKYVFLPHNGGIGNVQVDYALVSNPGAPGITGIEVGVLSRVYGVPRNNGKPYHRNAHASYFRMHR
jgi:hypothetical protein